MPSPSPAHTGWLTLNLVSQLSFGLLAMTICLPSMQQWPAEFGATQAQVQFGFGGFIAAYGVMQLLYGALSDRIGRKPVLLFGVALGTLASLAAAMSTTLWALNLARIAQGAGCAAGMVVARALVQDLFSGRERTRVMAVIGMLMGLCPPSAMLLGGFIHARWGWQANFGLMTGLGLLLFTTAWRWLPQPAGARPAGPVRAGQLIAGYAELLREPLFVRHVGILAMTAAAFYTFLGGAPLVLAGYGVAPERVGLYVMTPPLAYVVGNLLTQRLVQRGLGDARLINLGLGITFGGMLLVLALGLAGLHTPLALALPMLAMGIGHGLLMPSALTGTVGLVPALAGSAAALAGLMQQLLGALGGYLVGLLPMRGPVWLALLMLGWTTLAIVSQRSLLRRRRLAAATTGHA